MTCKPELGMKKITAKVGYFIEGATPKEAGQKLASQLGGDSYKWEQEVKEQVKKKVFVSERSTGDDRVGPGKLGYRVHARQEENVSVKSPAPAYNNRSAVMA